MFIHPVLMAARATVQTWGGNDEVAGKLLRNARGEPKSGNTLQAELDPNKRDAKLGLLDAVTLVSATGDRRILEAFAEECGCTVLQLPDMSINDGDTLKHVSKLVAEFGDVLRDVSEATADGSVSDNELQTIHTQSLELIGALHALQAHCTRLNERAKPAALRAVA